LVFAEVFPPFFAVAVVVLEVSLASLGSDGGCLLEAAAAGFDAALLLGGGAAGLCFSKIAITACLEVGYIIIKEKCFTGMPQYKKEL